MPDNPTHYARASGGHLWHILIASIETEIRKRPALCGYKPTRGRATLWMTISDYLPPSVLTWLCPHCDKRRTRANATRNH